VRRADEVVYIERTAENSCMMRVVQIIGAHAPLHITAVGKIFLAAETPQGIAEYISRTSLPRFTDNTLTEAKKLAAELDEVRKRQYAFDNEEAERGVCCVGAGIYSDEGKLIAGLSVSAPTERFRKAWAESVRQAAERISRAVGHR
jgi:DNA-binding IclR family transcriptional regulator